MAEYDFDVLVIGSGPGGYVAAIRAGQLGLDTTLVESERLGGTCLIRGCIPSKAMIHAADEFEKARHWANGSPLGIQVQQAAIDIAKTVRWKDAIVSRLTGGVGALLKRAGVQVLQGWATIEDGKTVTVQDAAGASVPEQSVFMSENSAAFAPARAGFTAADATPQSPAVIVDQAFADRLAASSGDDRLVAGGGDDSLAGDTGNDYLDGGPGRGRLRRRRGPGPRPHLR